MKYRFLQGNDTLSERLHRPSGDVQDKKWVDKHDLMEEFKISERTLFNLRKKNELPFAPLDRTVYYNRTRLEERLRKLSGLIVVIIQVIFYSIPDAGMVMEL